MNNLSELLTKMNLDMLDAISEEEFSLRELAEKIECSPSKVHQAIQIFQKNDLVKTEPKKNRLIIKANRKSVLYKKIKALININKILGSNSYKNIKRIGKIGVYGSYAQGTDEKQSDVDLLIISDKKELQIRALIRNLENKLNKKVNPLIITKQKFNNLDKEDQEFYIRLKLTTAELNGDIFG